MQLQNPSRASLEFKAEVAQGLNEKVDKNVLLLLDIQTYFAPKRAANIAHAISVSRDAISVSKAAMSV